MAGVEQLLNETTGLAKRIYDTGVVDTEQRLTITYDELPTKSWNIRGAGWFGDAHLIRSSSFKFATETEALPQDTTETNKQFTINSVEHQGKIVFTKKFLTNLVGGVTSFEDYLFKVEDIIRSCKKNQNQSCYIGPSMQRTTLTSAPNPSATFTVASTQYLFNGMYIDIYDAAGAVLVVNNAQITNIVGLTVTVAVAVTAASGTTVFLHQENLGGNANKGATGLPDQCDDGTDYSATFEGLSRTTYPTWRGNRIDAATVPLTNDLLQKMQNTIRINSGHDYMTEDYINFVHPDSVRRYIGIILPQKRYIDAKKYDSGMEKPNMLEWNGKGIVVDPDCPKNSWIMYNRNHGGKMELVPMETESMLGGTTMKWNAGYMEGVVLTYANFNLGTNKPNSNLITVNLATVN